MASDAHDDDSAQAGDDLPPRSDLHLYEKALRERWPLSPAVRLQLLRRMTKILDRTQLVKKTKRADGTFRRQVTSEPFDRHAIAAARVLLAADRLNLEQMRLERGLADPETPTVRDALAEAERRAQAHRPEVPPPQP